MASIDCQTRSVVLVGFMGAGKTTTGREVANLLGWPFVDLDDVIEARERRTVPEIFSASGESGFRRAEAQALSDILAKVRLHPTVLALGGGAYVQSANVAAIRDAGLPVVFLDASFEELRRRCTLKDGTRPLFGDLEEFQRLYEARQGSYAQAGFSINTAGKSPSAVAAELIALLHLDR